MPGAGEKSCDELAHLFRETIERFIATKEGFAEWLEEALRKIGEVLSEANEEHVLMSLVGVVAARAAATTYLTLLDIGTSEEEALEEAKRQICGAMRMAEELLEEMVKSGVLRGGGQDASARGEHR